SNPFSSLFGQPELVQMCFQTTQFLRGSFCPCDFWPQTRTLPRQVLRWEVRLRELEAALHLRFWTRVSAVSEIFFMMLLSVSMSFVIRSIIICRRREVISDTSFKRSSVPFNSSATKGICPTSDQLPPQDR